MILGWKEALHLGVFAFLVSTLMLLYTLCRPIIFLWSKVTARRVKPLYVFLDTGPSIG